MSELTFYIDIENSTGTRYGSGPITSAARWTYTARMDRAGEFSFSFPATDTQASIVQRKRVARAWALVGGVWTDVGAGIIDNIVRRPQADGTVWLEVSGSDLLRELTYRSVKNLQLADSGGSIPHATALTSIAAYAPSGWTFTADSSPPNDYVYGRFAGETVLNALIKTADSSMTHFYRGTGRNVTFAHTFSSSGVRAIVAGTGDLVAETCAITGLTETYDSYDLITRIYPRGSGNGDVQLTLRATSRSAPAGFTLDKTNNYIENDTAEATYGIIEQYVEYREIGPIANTAADLEAAADMLFDVALDELQRRSTDAEQAYYDLMLAGCSALLRPMQTVRVVYQDVDAAIDVDEDLNILEATWQVDQSGVQTTAALVSTTERWAQNDAGTIADSIAQGYVYQAHPQLNANSYTTGYTKNIDPTYNAEFRFRLGDEVVQVQQVLLEFQLLPFESTVRSIASSTATTSSGGGTTATSSSGGGTTSSSSGDHSHTVTISSHTHDVTIPNHQHSVTTNNHSHSVTLSDHTHEIPDHKHYFIVYPQSGSVNGVNLSTGGSGSGTLGHDSTYFSDQQKVYTTTSIDESTTSDGGGTTITSSSGGGETVSSANGGGTTQTSSSGGGSTPTSSSGGAHTHTVSAHTHDVTIAAHTHTVTPTITGVYGIYREGATKTYDISQLQYRINSGAWADLADDAVDAGDDWWQLDITDAVIDAVTFRPNQVANLIEIGVIDPLSVSVFVHTPASLIHISAPGIGNMYTEGNILTVSGTTNYDGDYELGAYIDPDAVVTTTTSTDYGIQAGTCDFSATVTVDALLSVRNVIQAIAYT